jgi:ABC-type Mn2+/Zn2+ transport system permease subunit
MSSFFGFEFFIFIFAFSAFIASSCVFLMWNDSCNLIHSASHASSISIVLSSIFTCIPFFFTSLFAGLFYFLSLSAGEKMNLSRNDKIAVSGSVLMMAGFFIGIVLQKDFGSYFVGDIFLISFADSLSLICVSVIILLYYIFNYKNLILQSIYKIEAKKRLFCAIILLLEVTFIMIISRYIGVVSSAIPMIAIPYIARKISKSPKWMIYNSFIISIFILFFSYLFAIYFNVYFSIVIVVLIVLIMICVFCFKH